MQTRPTDQPAVTLRRVYAVINPMSGGVGRAAAGQMAALLAEHGLDHRITEFAPGASNRRVRAAIDAGPDLVVVLGGDGTARWVAEMCGPEGPLVAPLSGGTKNKLSHALYGAGSWREALSDAITRGAARWVPGGVAEGRAFYCRAVLGPPALLAPAREAIRFRQLGQAWRRAVYATRQARRTRVNYETDGEIGSGLALGLICPTVSRAEGEPAPALEAAVLDLQGAKAGVRLALTNLIGDWRDDPDMTVRPWVSGRAWAREPIPAMLDGEFFPLGRQVHARFQPHAFRALAPEGEREPG